jgi:DNA-binding NarL/FixJ family response regulator
MHVPSAARLSPRETEVLERLAQGTSNKVMAADLGISISTVAAFLARVRKKLGAPRPALLLRCTTPTPASRSLTRAEEDVLRLLLDGLSYQEIATARGRTVRTVCKQIQAIYRKCGVSCRRELVAARPQGTVLVWSRASSSEGAQAAGAST